MTPTSNKAENTTVPFLYERYWLYVFLCSVGLWLSISPSNISQTCHHATYMCPYIGLCPPPSSTMVKTCHHATSLYYYILWMSLSLFKITETCHHATYMYYWILKPYESPPPSSSMVKTCHHATFLHCVQAYGTIISCSHVDVSLAIQTYQKPATMPLPFITMYCRLGCPAPSS